MGKREKLKQDKKRLSRLKQKSISMSACLSRVLGIGDNNLLSGNITHEDIKALMPNLVRKSYDYVVNNPQVIYNGEIFLVCDCKGRVVPYVNPKLLVKTTEFQGDFKRKKKREEIPNVKEIDLSSLSIYELKQLLEIYSEYEIRSAYRKVHNEMMSRRDCHHNSQMSVNRILRKERKNERFVEE